MRLLLDTQIFLWAVMDSPRLTVSARELMVKATEVDVSAASL